VTDATILIPTHDHARLLPYAVRSALGQADAEVELFVVGDGVGDDTRLALEPFLSDPRVRFFDRPKGERHGERYRHEALQDSTAPIVCYLCDDDLLLPGHVAQMRDLLRDADLAHDAPLGVQPDGTLRFNAVDLGDPGFLELLEAGRVGGLTGVSHTREAYDRLPRGWHPAPADVHTDVHMLRQFAALPGFRAATGRKLTSLAFSSLQRAHMSADEREAELREWEERLADPDFLACLDTVVADAAWQAALRLKLTSWRLEREVDRIQRTRWWRMRRAAAELRPIRVFRSRSGGRR
jgi:glycosyltransferase involved in cell wall biosynthesis